MSQDLHQPQQPEPLSRKRRKDAGQPRWEDRDYSCLYWIGEQGLIRFDQLQRLLGRKSLELNDWNAILSPSATRNALERWTRGKLINSAYLLPKEPQYYWLSTHGFQFASLDLPHYHPTNPKRDLDQIRYLFACNQVRLFLDLTRRTKEILPGDWRDWVWLSERIFQHASLDPTRKHTPSGAFVNRKGASIGIQVELIRKEQAEHLMRLYVSATYEQVWYFALSEPFQYLIEIYKRLEQAGLDMSKISIINADSIILAPP
jgi:hypothetical protein